MATSEPPQHKAVNEPGVGAAAAAVQPQPLTLTAFRLKPETMMIVPAPADRDWMDWHRNGANRCLPLRVANQAGWFILNDRDFEVSWNGKPHPTALKISYPDGESRFVRNIFGHGILTWHIPYLFRTPPGYNLIVRGPTNQPKDGICPLDGIVETDWAVATFTMNWKLTRPRHKVAFAKDEPICMIVPVRRGEAEEFRPVVRNIESAPELRKSYLEWGEARQRLIEEKARLVEQGKIGAGTGRVAPWQPDYFRGKTRGGQQAAEHQVVLEIRPFEEREPPISAPDEAPAAQSGNDEGVRSLWNHIKAWASR